MSQTPASSASVRRPDSRLPRFAALAAVPSFFVGISLITYWNTRTLRSSAGWVAHTYEVIGALDDVLSLMKDAETGQRGFIITGDDRYLDPYNTALAGIDTRIAEVTRLVSDNPNQ